MDESLVGLCHPVGFLPFLDGRTLSGGSVHDLACQLLHHALAGTSASRADEPAHGEGEAALFADIDGHLVGRATDTAGLDLDRWRGVPDGLLEDLQRWALLPLLN